MIMGTVTKQQKKVPGLRFPGFSDEWSNKNLEDVTMKIQDGTHFSPDVLEGEGSFKYITSKNIRMGRLDLKDVLYIDSEAHRSIYSRCDVKKDDVLLTKDGASTGNVCINTLEEEFSLLSSVAFLRSDPNESYHSFLYQLLASSIGQRMILSSMSGQAITRITLTKLRNYNFLFPSVKEQQKIADFLGSVDAWLDNLRQQKTALETYKRGMMQKLFTQQVRFKDDSGKDFPEWTTVLMSDVGDTFNGLSGKSADDFGEGEPYITYKQIFDNSSIDPTKFALVKVASGERQSRAQRGDILFTTSSETPEEVGYASVLTEDLNPYLNSFSFGYRPKSLTTLIPEYARYHFRSAPFRREVIKLAQGSTRYNISKVQFMKLSTQLPSTAEQQKIAEFLTALDQTITAKTEEITQVERWKKGLMQKMFV